MVGCQKKKKKIEVLVGVQRTWGPYYARTHNLQNPRLLFCCIGTKEPMNVRVHGVSLYESILRALLEALSLCVLCILC